MLAIYVIAMIATCWHFAYGIWLFAAKWGITPGDKARKNFGYVCGVVGAVLCFMGLISMYAVVYKYPNAPGRRHARAAGRLLLTRTECSTTKRHQPVPAWHHRSTLALLFVIPEGNLRLLLLCLRDRTEFRHGNRIEF